MWLRLPIDYSILTSCFKRHFPSSVRFSVLWLAGATCSESIIMSSSVRGNVFKNTQRCQSKCAHQFVYLPSTSSLFPAGSCTFLAIQLTARRQEESVTLLLQRFPRVNRFTIGLFKIDFDIYKIKRTCTSFKTKICKHLQD